MKWICLQWAVDYHKEYINIMQNTYNPAYPTPHGYAKGGRLDVKRIKSKKFKTKKGSRKKNELSEKPTPFMIKMGKRLF